VHVPAGAHRIRVENLGRDWVNVASYTFTGCQVLDKPNVLVRGMRTDKLAILWIQNKDSSWYNHARASGETPELQPGLWAPNLTDP